MKYFIKENWLKINSGDASVRDDGMRDIKKRYEEYKSEFEKAKGKLSKTFLNIYDKYDGFHDWKISGMQYLTSEKQKNDKFIITLSDDDLQYSLEFQKVSSLTMNIHKTEAFYFWCSDVYSYDEWTLTDDGSIHYSLLMLSFSEIELVCERAVLRKVKNSI